MCVLANALDVVATFCRVHVAAKFRVEVERMIRRTERKTKIVHRVNVFETFGVVSESDAAGLPGIVEIVREFVCTCVELTIVTRLVDTNSPKNYRWMIPITPDHRVDI